MKKGSGTGHSPRQIKKAGGVEHQTKARRRLIQVLAVGGGIATSKLVPGKWIVPQVKSVLLPAHATGTTCRLGNTTPVVLVAQGNSEPAGPGGPESLAEQMARVVVPEAHALDTPIELTGCFSIEFICNAPGGTLCASAFRPGMDSDDDDSPICVGFDFDVPFDLEGWCIRIQRQENGTAILDISDSVCGDNISLEQVTLVPNANCVPVISDGA